MHQHNSPFQCRQYLCVFKRPKTGRERLVFCFFNVLSLRPNLQSVAKSFCSKYCFMHLFIISLTSSSLSCNPLNCVWLGKGIEKQKQLEKLSGCKESTNFCKSFKATFQGKDLSYRKKSCLKGKAVIMSKVT